MAEPAHQGERSFASFAEFLPFYLSEHSDRTCRRLHFVGSTLALGCLVAFVATGRWGFLPQKKTNRTLSRNGLHSRRLEGMIHQPGAQHAAGRHGLHFSIAML